MTDRDTITLPREVVQEALEALEDFVYRGESTGWLQVVKALAALRTALASPRLEVTVDPRLTAEEAAAISAAIDARKKEQSEGIEALRRDAERYRYLRNRDPKEVFNKSGKAAGVWIDWEDDMSGLQLLTGDDADAAIDAAMKEDKR